MARTSEAAEKTLAQRQSGGGLGYCLWVGAGACGDVQRPYGASSSFANFFLPNGLQPYGLLGHSCFGPKRCVLWLTVCNRTDCSVRLVLVRNVVFCG